MQRVPDEHVSLWGRLYHHAYGVTFQIVTPYDVLKVRGILAWPSVGAKDDGAAGRASIALLDVCCNCFSGVLALQYGHALPPRVYNRRRYGHTQLERFSAIYDFMTGNQGLKLCASDRERSALLEMRWQLSSGMHIPVLSVSAGNGQIIFEQPRTLTEWVDRFYAFDGAADVSVKQTVEHFLRKATTPTHSPERSVVCETVRES